MIALQVPRPVDQVPVSRPNLGHEYFSLLLVVIITLLTFERDYSRQFEEGYAMPLIANNAVSILAASIGADDTTISLASGTGGKFPNPSGDWFPLTLIKPNGESEIVHCTGRNGDVLTIIRAREGTSGKAFASGDRAELRLTAGTLEAMLEEVRLDAKLTFTPVQQGGGAGQGTNKIYLGWSNEGLRLQVDNTDVGLFWTSQNFNPANYLPVSGGTMTGNITIQGAVGQITFNDTDWGSRHIHCNDGNIGFMNSSGGWACYSTNDGTFIASGNIGAYSDRRHKREIRSIEDGLDLVEALRGVTYVRKSDGKACVGVIAQEVQRVVPEAVVDTGDGLAVDYGNLVSVLIPAVQELSARVRRLEGA